MEGKINPITKPQIARITAIVKRELKTGTSKKQIAVITDMETIRFVTSIFFVILPNHAEEIAAVAPKIVKKVPAIADELCDERASESMNNANVGLSNVTPTE